MTGSTSSTSSRLIPRTAGTDRTASGSGVRAEGRRPPDARTDPEATADGGRPRAPPSVCTRSTSTAVPTPSSRTNRSPSSPPTVPSSRRFWNRSCSHLSADPPPTSQNGAIPMNTRIRSAVVSTVVALGIAGTTVAAANAPDDRVSVVREATARFHDIETAKAEGYELGYVNGAGTRIITGCIASPTAGVMGYHYFKKSL